MKEIYKIQKEISILEQVGSLLGWDAHTYMPPKTSKSRAEQEAYISRLAHEKFISKKFQNLVKKELKNKSKLNNKDVIILERLDKDLQRAKKIPPEFVEEFSRVSSEAYFVWKKAKKENNFELFAPYLEKIVKLNKEQVKYINLPGHPYNSLLDDYEEGMTVEKLDPTFAYLKKETVKLLKKIQSSRRYKKIPLLNLKATKKQKVDISNFIFDKLGLSTDFSRLDETEHPFSTRVGTNDVRITTNYENSLITSFFSTAHEAGHALYSLGYPKKYIYTDIYGAPSLGMHESQSRFWENIICRGYAFWTHFYKIFQSKFPRLLKIHLEDFHLAINRVRPSLIRVEADEVTYNLHIIMRYEIEKDLISGKIKVKDLPEIWNKKMKEYFGITPKTDTKGVLQDVHWSGGSFGYFPTYTLGNIYSAQLFDALLKEHPDIMKEVKKGEYKNVLKWLRKNVHIHGRTITTEEIIKKVCGRGLNPKALMDYLENKYSKVYKF